MVEYVQALLMSDQRAMVHGDHGRILLLNAPVLNWTKSGNFKVTEHENLPIGELYLQKQIKFRLK